MSKKGDFENPKVINRYFSTKSVLEQYGFVNSTVPSVRKNSTIRGPPVFIFHITKLNKSLT